MFGIGTGELLLLFIIALVVLGPERLPGLARDIGKTMQDFRKTSDELTGEFLRADEEAKKAATRESPAAVAEPPVTPATPVETGEAATATSDSPEESAPPDTSAPPPPAAGDDTTAFDREAQRAADEREREEKEGRARKEVPEGWKIPEDVPEPDRFS